MRKELGSLETAGNKVDPAMRKAGSSMDSMGKSASSSASNVKGLEGQTSKLISAASGLAAPLAAAFSISKIAAAAEQYTNITNRLRLVTEGTEQLAFAQESVYQVAQNSRQTLEVTAEVYQRIAQNAQQLGLNFEQVASVTETVAKTVALSGASAQAADAAMVQFGQALASGTLRGDELNSIMEQTPALAQAIARGLGVSIGQLRAMGAEGKLTSAAIVTALQSQKDKVDELSSSLNLTVSQSFTAFNNALIVTIGKLDQATGASSGLAQGIASLAGAMDRFNSGEFLDFFRENKQTVAGLNNELSVTLAGIRDLQSARTRLSGDANDTAFFNFKFYNRAEIDAEIAGLQSRANTIKTLTSKLAKDSGAAGGATPKDDAPSAAVNAEYEKLLTNLKKQAALQGENTEAARVRYAIEAGELGKLLPEQEKLLLKYAEEKDAKKAAEEAAKKSSAASLKAQSDSLKGIQQAESAFAKLYSQYDPVGQAARLLVEEQGQLDQLFDKGRITQEQYGQAMAQASINYSALIAKTGELSQAEQYRLQIQKQLQNQQDAVNAQAAAVGMGGEQAARAQERLTLEKETNDKILGLRTELANAQGEKQRQALQAQIDITNEMFPQQIAIMENGWAQVDAAQANWMNGITAGWDNYQAKVADVAYQTETIMTDSLDTVTAGYGSAFSKMALDGQSFGEVTRGVFDSLARTVLDGLGQMGAQWLVLQGIKLAFGQTEQALHIAKMAGISTEMTAELGKEAAITTAKVTADGVATASSLAATATTTTAQVAAAGTTLASWLPAALVASIGSFGAAAVVGGGALLAAFALIKGFSEGGYTGPGGVNQPAGIVHKGEVVWSQADINRSGGVAAVEAMRRGDAMPAGISASGSGRSSSAQTSTGSAAPVQQPAQVIIHLIEDASKAGTSGPSLTRADVVEVYVSNIFSEGEIHDANRAKYGLSSQGT
jgi:tape measure domain-containing protein